MSLTVDDGLEAEFTAAEWALLVLIRHPFDSSKACNIFPWFEYKSTTLFPIVRMAALFRVEKERSRTFLAIKNTSSTRLGAYTLSRILIGEAIEIATETLQKEKERREELL